MTPITKKTIMAQNAMIFSFFNTIFVFISRLEQLSIKCHNISAYETIIRVKNPRNISPDILYKKMANTDKGEFIHRAFYKKAYLFVNQYMRSLSINKAVLVSHFEG